MILDELFWNSPLEVPVSVHHPSVERRAWKLKMTSNRRYIVEALCDQMEVSSDVLEQTSWHGGIYVNRRRLSLEDWPNVLEKDWEIEIYRFLEEPAEIQVGLRDVIFEDANYIIMNKAAWMPVQGTRASRRYSLEEKTRLLMNNPQLIAVHRLDRQTSGLVVFAQHAQAASYLSQQFSHKAVQKEYLAICPAIQGPKRWTVEGYIGRDLEKMPKIVFKFLKEKQPKFRWTQTHFECLQTKGSLELISAKPITGRTHQIRIHLSHSRQSIWGDTLYGDQFPQKAGRFQLHAHRLSFKNINSDVLNLEAPLPKDFLWEDFSPSHVTPVLPTNVKEGMGHLPQR